MKHCWNIFKKNSDLKRKVNLENFLKFKKFYDTHYIGESIEKFPDPITYTNLTRVEHYKAGKDSKEKFMLNKPIDATKRKCLFSHLSSNSFKCGNIPLLYCIKCQQPRLLYPQKKNSNQWNEHTETSVE